MKDFHGCLHSLICLWIPLSRNWVLAIDIPTSFLNLESVRNATSIGAIDPAFRFAPIFLGDKLRPIPCLLNSVNVALQLAVEDFEGPLFETVYRLDSHPQVEIAVIPDEQGGSIPRKFAVWGLNVGIEFMMSDSHFQTAVFLLSFRGQSIARISFKAAGVADSTSNSITNATESISGTPALSNTTAWLLKASTDANTTDTDATNNPHLEIAFQLTGSVVTIYEIFYMVLDILRELALFKRGARLADTTTLVPTANLDLSIRQDDPPRTVQNPPFLQAEWLMRALAQTPAYMLEQRSFREVDMVLFVDEIKVGEASVKRPRTPGNGLLPASHDVSTS